MSEDSDEPWTYDVDALRDMGLFIAYEQEEYFNSPTDRTAVALFGVPDPVCLYNMGPDWTSTIWQVAPPGQPADERGFQACVLPAVMKPGPQDEMRQSLSYWMDPLDSNVPRVVSWLCEADWTWHFLGDDCPMEVAIWDLWPIPEEDVDLWAHASNAAWGCSKMDPIWHLADIEQGGDAQDDRLGDLQDAYYAELDPAKKQAAFKAWQDAEEAFMKELVADVTHPISGHIDPQIPPVLLPPEQASIWSSLQALSQRNWDLLSKQAGAADQGPYGRGFDSANRRLCPWF